MMLRDHVLQHFGGTDLGITRECGVGGKSEHKEGRAWDWGIPASADVDGFLSWLLDSNAENARRAGIMYLIYNHQAWRAYKDPHWVPYTGPDPHDTHIHISLSRQGGAGLTSLYQTGMMDASLAPSLGGAKGLLPLLIGAAVGFLTIRTIL
jgi:hypothetical protein